MSDPQTDCSVQTFYICDRMSGRERQRKEGKEGCDTQFQRVQRWGCWLHAWGRTSSQKPLAVNISPHLLKVSDEQETE